MTRWKHTAQVLLLLLAGQLAGSALGAVSAGPCCPAMAEGDGADRAAPCASLSALGCCEMQARPAAADPAVPPAQGVLGPVFAAPLPAPAFAARSGPAHSPAFRERGLRTTVLRL